MLKQEEQTTTRDNMRGKFGEVIDVVPEYAHGHWGTFQYLSEKNIPI